MKSSMYPTLLRSVALVVSVTALMSSCAGQNTRRGAAAGAVLGGVTGAIIAQRTDGDATRGAIIGAATGGVVGAAVGAAMDRQARELQESLEQAEVVAVKDSTGTTVGVQIVFSSAILFDVNRADLRPGVMASLDTLAASLERYPETVLVVVGHTDSDGTEAYNQTLSERRAEAVASHLRQRGVAGERMRALGMGESAPIAPNDTPANKQRNRRVEIGIVPVATDPPES